MPIRQLLEEFVEEARINAERGARTGEALKAAARMQRANTRRLQRIIHELDDAEKRREKIVLEVIAHIDTVTRQAREHWQGVMEKSDRLYKRQILLMAIVLGATNLLGGSITTMVEKLIHLFVR